MQFRVDLYIPLTRSKGWIRLALQLVEITTDQKTKTGEGDRNELRILDRLMKVPSCFFGYANNLLIDSMSENKSNKEIVEMEGEVTELLPGTKFRVKLSNGHIILAHISGKMRIHFIKLMPGDKVQLEMSPYDLTRGRITRRL